jgi:hypothetical protein
VVRAPAASGSARQPEPKPGADQAFPAVKARAMIACAVVALALTVGGGGKSSASSSSSSAPAAACEATHPGADPIALYGNEIHFRVLRNGSPVGFHRVRFSRQGPDLIAQTKFQIAVDLLFINAYRYEYTSTALWRHGCLISIAAETNDNGTVTRVEAVAEDGGMRISGPSGTAMAARRHFPTEHWHSGVLASDRVLNTITGELSAVDILDRGKETVTVNGFSTTARRYAYTGQLRNEVWYDDIGRWVKMRFTAKDGSTIEYVWERCRSDSLADRNQ